MTPRERAETAIRQCGHAYQNVARPELPDVACLECCEKAIEAAEAEAIAAERLWCIETFLAELIAELKSLRQAIEKRPVYASSGGPPI